MTCIVTDHNGVQDLTGRAHVVKRVADIAGNLASRDTNLNFVKNIYLMQGTHRVPAKALAVNFPAIVGLVVIRSRKQI